LTPTAFQQAIAHLTGVVLNQPVGSSDAYRFNLREAVLAAGLISDPAQIYFLEEAIAALLPELHRDRADAPLKGGILVVSAGTATTELVLVKQAEVGHLLARQEIALGRLAYAGNALDQDIICHLLHPTATQWQDLNLRTLNLPLPGEPDLEARYPLQQRLESVSLGQALLQAVRQVKPALCQQDVEFTFQGQHWQLNYRDLQRWILVPYLQQLNREINQLLIQLDLPPDAIQTIICTGGMTAIPAVERGLQRKFPQAAIAQAASQQPEAPNVSAGLSLLPYFPSVLDPVRHQFNEYFLLRTTLQTLPIQAEPISAAHILHLLETQGIPSTAAQGFVAGLLEGQLPAGWVLSRASTILLAPKSLQQPEYQALATAPLFSRQGQQVYRLNRQQRDRLWNHLQIILANTRQTLTEPLAIAGIIR
jgi:molecular chaperone DnaK (HSP70)